MTVVAITTLISNSSYQQNIFKMSSVYVLYLYGVLGFSFFQSSV